MSGQTCESQSESVGERNVVSERFDWGETAPSVAVVETVAGVVDEEPTDIGPVYDSIDPDALDTLFRPTGSTPTCEEGYVSFTFADHSIAVHADGDVIVRPPVGTL